MKRIIFKILLIIILVTAGFILYQKFQPKGNALSSPAPKQTQLKAKIISDKIKKMPITDGSTYGSLMATSGISYATSQAIYEAAKDLYDLVKIRAGKELELLYDGQDGRLKQLSYKIDSENQLIVSRVAFEAQMATNTAATSTAPWRAEIKKIPYTIKIKTAQGVIKTSMYQAAIDNNIDIRAIIELANAFQWTIDFAMDPRVGDTFKFIYEERYLDGEYIMPGKILAGRYTNAGKKFDVYYFEESEENKGFFDAQGNSVQKMFLKAPVAFKYISSGFTTGARYIAKFKTFTSSHRAIDYAAPIGTPIRSVGDGTVIFTGWAGPYGNKTSIRHNGTYTTNYCHQSKIIVKYGQKVKQGEVIGYVGTTGFSTGPHLHYEMVKNGVKINPLREILPPGKPIKQENQDRFFKEIKKWQDKLDNDT